MNVSSGWIISTPPPQVLCAAARPPTRMAPAVRCLRRRPTRAIVGAFPVSDGRPGHVPVRGEVADIDPCMSATVYPDAALRPSGRQPGAAGRAAPRGPPAPPPARVAPLGGPRDT